MNYCEISLVPVQQTGDPHDLSFAKTPSSSDIKPRDVSSPPPVSSNLNAEIVSSSATLSSGEEQHSQQQQQQQQQQQHQRLTEAKLVASAAAQIKRKRGRPRKYTFGPFPSQVANASHTRLSLPSTFSPVETTALLSNDSNGSGSIAQPKKPRLGRPSKSYMHSSNGTDTPLTMKGIEIQDPSSAPAVGFATPEHPQHHDMTSNKFHSSAISTTLFPKIIYSTQSPVLLNGHTNAVNGTSSSNGANITATATTTTTTSQVAFPAAATATLTTAPLKAPTPVFMEYYNSPFSNGVAGPASALMPPPPPPPTPATQLSVAGCSTMEAGLIRRLLPQAEAAVSATRAGGYPGPHAWTAEMVGSFIATLPGCQNLARAFIENEVDGAALLCLEQRDLMSILKLKLGPAVKILGAIRTLRQALLSIPFNDLTAEHSSILATMVSCFPPLTSASGTQTSAAGNSTSFSINNLAVEETPSLRSPSPSGGVGVVVVNGTGERGSPSMAFGGAEKPSR